MVAERLGRWSPGGASAERMYRTLTDPTYQRSTNKHGRRINSRNCTPMHVMAAHALRQLPNQQGNLNQASPPPPYPFLGTPQASLLLSASPLRRSVCLQTLCLDDLMSASRLPRAERKRPLLAAALTWFLSVSALGPPTWSIPGPLGGDATDMRWKGALDLIAFPGGRRRRMLSPTQRMRQSFLPQGASLSSSVCLPIQYPHSVFPCLP